jgi:hypothetical protein
MNNIEIFQVTILWSKSYSASRQEGIATPAPKTVVGELSNLKHQDTLSKRFKSDSALLLGTL